MSNAYIISGMERNYLYIDSTNDGCKYAIYFYNKGVKLKDIWYQESNIIDLGDYSSDFTLKVFIRNENDELIEQFYVDSVSGNLVNKKVVDLVKNQLSQTPDVKNIYTDEDENLYRKNISLLWVLSILEPNSTTYLLKICSIVKGWCKVFNDDTLSASKEALKRQERTDAVIYTCLSIIATSSWEEGKTLIRNLQLVLANPNNINICNVFLGLYEFENEEFDAYCNRIKSLKENQDKSFEHYIFTPIQTVYTLNRKIEIDKKEVMNSLIGNNIEIDIPSLDKDTHYIISLSCNKKYFDLYSKYILDTLEKHCANYKVVMFLSDGENTYYREKLNKYSNVCFYTLKSISNINLGPISSILRYYYVYDLLSKFQLPVYVFDLDSVVLDDLERFIDMTSDYDVSSRILKRGVLPWEKYTGGFTLFNVTDIALQLALEIKYITENTISNDYPQWWIDQNVIEAAIRQIKYQDSDIRIHNALNYRDDFIKMPVGVSDTKKFLLDNLYYKSLSN